MDGQPDISGDILSRNVCIPNKNVIVTLGFDRIPIGTAFINQEENRIMADIEIDKNLISPEIVVKFCGVIGGNIIRRNG